jgi:hypothetical protein
MLMDRYGRPSNVFERGEAVPNAIDAIRNGTFISITEWSRPGGTLRFGMPRRVDGQVRMELQFGLQFPPIADPFWSIEQVR